MKYDLIVAGGGFTGVAGAVAAAREGAKVLLIERYGFLGGAACACYVNPFMRYTLKTEQGTELLSKGIFEEILDRLDALGGLKENRDTFSEELLKLVLDRLTKEAGVKVLFHSYLQAVHKEGKHITSVRVVNKSGTMELAADYFIDATGDADLSALAGCPYHVGREADQLCQPMTLCFRLANVDMEAFKRVRPKINGIYQQFQREGKIKNPREDVLIFYHVSDGVIHFNSTRVVKLSPLDAFDLSETERRAREQVYELYHFMKDNIEGFENCTLLASAPQTGVRESRMVDGAYTLTEEDLCGCRKFEDSIACGNYGVDIHSPDGSGTHRRLLPHTDYYTIPYRSLLPKGADNLLVAGRCISSTHEAQSGYRIMPICCCIGEAAGLAAGLALQSNCMPAEISVEKLHERMDHYNCRY